MNERHVLDEGTFVEIVIWRVPLPLRASKHRFKYRLALVSEDVCVFRYDNEAGKGDHRHVEGKETPYIFTGPDVLLTDFWADVENWMRKK